jgi:putative hydrolase of the HAD superfamily
MTIEVVLFDLGGVLVELGGIEQMAHFAGEDSEDELWRRWLECPWVRRFERGRCDADSFSQGMVDAWSLTVGPAEFLEAFISWPKGLMPGAQELVQTLSTTTRVACLSNTNRLHAERQWIEFGIGELFHDHFFSHEMGLVKPDREAFDHVLEALDRPGERVLFLDDNQINVDGARAAGLRAERARGPAEARAILAAHGLRTG